MLIISGMSIPDTKSGCQVIIYVLASLNVCFCTTLVTAPSDFCL